MPTIAHLTLLAALTLSLAATAEAGEGEAEGGRDDAVQAVHFKARIMALNAWHLNNIGLDPLEPVVYPDALRAAIIAGTEVGHRDLATIRVNPRDEHPARVRFTRPTFGSFAAADARIDFTELERYRAWLFEEHGQLDARLDRREIEQVLAGPVHARHDPQTQRIALRFDLSQAADRPAPADAAPVAVTAVRVNVELDRGSTALVRLPFDADALFPSRFAAQDPGRVPARQGVG